MTLPVWPIVFLVFGCIVGSFLRVCIHRLPLGQNLFLPSPHSEALTPWPLNTPLLGWFPFCKSRPERGTAVSAQYFGIEALTGAAFLSCWLSFGQQSVALALVYCLFLAGLIVATATDLEHLIIPDEITIGGMVAGVLCSLLLPRLHGESTWFRSLAASVVGLGLGGGGIYAIVRGGKLLFGRQRIRFGVPTRIVFSETAVHLPGKEMPLDELFYRQSDKIVLDAHTVELVDRCYRGVRVRLSPGKLEIGRDEFSPEAVHYMEVVTAEVVVPREAMGLGDAKLMAAIGAFLGWTAVLFTVVVGALVGSVYGMTMIVLRRRTWSGRLYFGPFLALGAAVWVFEGPPLVHGYRRLMEQFITRHL